LRAKYAPIDSSPGAIPWAYSGGATVIQMGHGIPLKANLSPGDSWLERMISWNSIDYAVFSSKAEKKHFQEYVEAGPGSERGWINNRLHASNTLYTGYPKTDAIVNSIRRSDEHETLSSDDSFDGQAVRTIGYFPTRREGHGLDLDDVIDLPQIEELLTQNEARLLIKPHRQLSLDRSIIRSERIQSVDPDTDSHEFLTEIDILITDYSSIFFDFLFLDRPIIFFTPDYSTYENIRGVHSNYENVIAGPRVNNSNELLRCIESIISDLDEYRYRRQEIQHQFFEYMDGNASKRIVEAITN
jgi:CDP-glycerol glycerophosphotransferase (TagB/SpsB family)